MGKTKLTTEEFIKRAKTVHGDKYDYSQTIYVNSRSKVKINCPIHGIFHQKANHHLSGSKCPKCNTQDKSLTTEEFIKRAKTVHGDKYDYSQTIYVNKRTKVKIIDDGIIKYILPSNHLNAKSHVRGLINTKDTEHFIHRAKLIHGNKYDYSKCNYTHNQTKIEIICSIHGSFWQTPNNHTKPNGSGCPKCDNSQYEEYIENYLNKNKINHIFRDKDKCGVEVDFYIPTHNLAIEVDGMYWHSELNNRSKNYHLNKTNLCKDNGVKLLHITDYEFKFKGNIIKSKLNSILGINKRKIHGRKCEIREIDSKLKSKFLNKYHLQGNDTASVKLGLFYKDRLVSVMTFCKRRVALGKKSNKQDEYELSRYCGNFNFYVIGGASKLLKYFERNYNPSKIVTYADKRWSTGDLYFKLGFTHTHDSKPNYWYFKNGYIKTGEIYHRFNFRKSELPKKLETFDPNKTEWENMIDNGWDRYWDCGNMVFEKIYS
jgi:very-short-patch-repair endonuclease/Zn ribbon nucleic-acid-binding protein